MGYQAGLDEEGGLMCWLKNEDGNALDVLVVVSN